MEEAVAERPASPRAEAAPDGRPSRRRRLVAAALALTCLQAVRLPLQGPGRGGGGEPWAQPVAVDPNTAPVAELAALAGIGRTRAAQIVLHRVRHGPFRTVDDLAAVDGLGPETVRALRPFLALSPRSRGAAAPGVR